MQEGMIMDLYYDEILKIIGEIRATERENILKAARLIADQVKMDKKVFVFGPGGHSNLAAMEVFFRAGGLSNILVFGIIVSIGMSLGGLTGYALNPARDIGPRIAHAFLPIKGKGSSNWGYAIVPLVGPIIGAIVAVLLYAAIPW